MDSLRAESGSMQHALNVMAQFLQQYKFTGKIILASDNLELVNRTKIMEDYSYRLPSQYTKPHMDIQCTIDQLIVEYYPNLTVTHVKGHQDSKKTSTLTWIETLNVRADALATQTRHEQCQLLYEQQCVWHPHYTIQLYINNLPIHKWMCTTIHQASTTDAYINFLRTKFNWSYHTYKEIAWEQKRQLQQRIPEHMRAWTIKLGTNRLPLNGEKFFQSPTIACPICRTAKETTAHFLTCPKYPCNSSQQNTQLIHILNKYRLDPYLRILFLRLASNQSCDTTSLLHAYPQFPIGD